MFFSHMENYLLYTIKLGDNELKYRGKLAWELELSKSSI